MKPFKQHSTSVLESLLSLLLWQRRIACCYWTIQSNEYNTLATNIHTKSHSQTHAVFEQQHTLIGWARILQHSTRHLSSACEIRNERTFWNFGFEDSRKSFPKRDDDDNDDDKNTPTTIANNSSSNQWVCKIYTPRFSNQRNIHIPNTHTLSSPEWKIRRCVCMHEQQNDFRVKSNVWERTGEKCFESAWILVCILWQATLVHILTTQKSNNTKIVGGGGSNSSSTGSNTMLSNAAATIVVYGIECGFCHVAPMVRLFRCGLRAWVCVGASVYVGIFVCGRRLRIHYIVHIFTQSTYSFWMKKKRIRRKPITVVRARVDNNTNFGCRCCYCRRNECRQQLSKCEMKWTDDENEAYPWTTMNKYSQSNPLSNLWS